MRSHQAGVWAALLLVAAQWSAAEVFPVDTLVVERQSAYEAERLFAGRVLGGKRANIAFELSGRVAAVEVEDGDRVEAGAVLASLDTRAFTIQQRELTAARREVAARLSQLTREVTRYEALAKQGHVSDGRIDDVRSSKIEAEARLRQVEEKLQAVSLNLNKSSLLAPFAGEVVGLGIEEGVVSESGEPVLQLIELAETEAVFGVSGNLGESLSPGQPLVVFGDAGRFTASLSSVSRNLDWRTQTRTVRVKLPSGTPVADGQTLYLHLPEVRQQAGFWLPKQALLEDVRGTWAVYQLVRDPNGGDYQVQKRSVRALYQYKGRVYVDGELDNGDLLIREGTHKVAPGQIVRLPAKNEALARRAES